MPGNWRERVWSAAHPRAFAVVIAMAAAAILLATISAARVLAGQGAYAMPRMLVPGTGRIVASDAETVMAAGGKPSVVLIRLRDAVAREPLDPFVVASLAGAEESAGIKMRTATLMQAAMKIDPRNVAARTWTILDHVRNARFEQAVFGFDRLMLLVPENRQQNLAALTALAQLPETKGAFDTVLAARPAWRANLFESLDRRGAGSDVVRRYQQFVGEAELPSALAIVLRDGDADTARAIRRKVLDATLQSRNVIDPQMTGTVGVAPFTWSKASVASGSISFAESGATISAPPGTPNELTAQKLLLAPGRYRLSVKGGATNSGGGLSGLSGSGSLQAQIKCDGGDRLVTLGIDGASRLRSAEFAVADGGQCLSQSLALLVDTSGSLQPVEATIQAIDIVRQ